jgi:hypothetical protein
MVGGHHHALMSLRRSAPTTEGAGGARETEVVATIAGSDALWKLHDDQKNRQRPSGYILLPSVPMLAPLSPLKPVFPLGYFDVPDVTPSALWSGFQRIGRPQLPRH